MLKICVVGKTKAARLGCARGKISVVRVRDHDHVDEFVQVAALRRAVPISIVARGLDDDVTLGAMQEVSKEREALVPVP